MNKKQNNNNNKKEKLLYDEYIVIPKARGNGYLKLKAYIDQNNQITRYSFAYINHRLCRVDNGRVLGYDNSHGYHHKHRMGIVESVEFTSIKETEEQFQQEFKVLHEQAKKVR